MAHYFFDICIADERIPDEEGMEFADLNAALNEARHSARELASKVLHGERDLEKACVEIRSGNGDVVTSLAIAEIFRHPFTPQFRDECDDCESAPN